MKNHCNRWTTNPLNTPYVVSVWRAIRNLWPTVLRKTFLKVGNGRKVSFWKDIWLTYLADSCAIAAYIYRSPYSMPEKRGISGRSLVITRVEFERQKIP